MGADHELVNVQLSLGRGSGFRAYCDCGWASRGFDTPGHARRAWADHSGRVPALER